MWTKLQVLADYSYTPMTWFFAFPFSTFCEKECEVGAKNSGLITKAEFKNPSSTSTVMKWKTEVCTL